MNSNNNNEETSSPLNNLSSDQLFTEGKLYISQGNLSMAVARILDASDLDHPEATLMAAAMYYSGVGVNRNQDEASRYAQKFISLVGQPESLISKKAFSIIDGSIGTINARRLIFGDDKAATSLKDTATHQTYSTLEEELGKRRKKRILIFGTLSAIVLIISAVVYRKFDVQSSRKKASISAASADYDPQDPAYLEPQESLGYYGRLKFEDFEEKVLILAEFKEPETTALYSESYQSSYSTKKNWKDDFKKAFNKGNSKSAFELFRELAGNTTSTGYEVDDVNRWRDRALYNMGVLLKNGFAGQPSDSKLAFDAFKLSYDANRNNFRTAYNLALMYEKGEGVTRDVAEARNFYEIASQRNDLWAAYNLGNLAFQEGEFEKAQQSYEKLTALDSYIGAYNLSLVILRNQNNSDSDKKHIYEILQKAATVLKDNKEVIFMIGNLEFQGYGVPKSIDNAIKRYKESGDKGFATAYSALGKTYADIKEDHSSAFSYFEKAANMNFPPAMFKLASYYYQGPKLQGSPIKATDLVSSYQWALLAKNGEFAAAASLLDSLENEMKPEEIAAAKKNASKWSPSKSQ